MMLEAKILSQTNFRDLPDFRLFPYSCKYYINWESTGDLDQKVERSTAEEKNVNGLDMYRSSSETAASSYTWTITR